MCPFDNPKTQLDLRRGSPHLREEVRPCPRRGKWLRNFTPRHTVVSISLLKFDLPVFSLELLKNYVLGGVLQ